MLSCCMCVCVGFSEGRVRFGGRRKTVPSILFLLCDRFSCFHQKVLQRTMRKWGRCLCKVFVHFTVIRHLSLSLFDEKPKCGIVYCVKTVYCAKTSLAQYTILKNSIFLKEDTEREREREWLLLPLQSICPFLNTVLRHLLSLSLFDEKPKCVESYTVKTLLSQSIRSLKIRFLKEDRERERVRG